MAEGEKSPFQMAVQGSGPRPPQSAFAQSAEAGFPFASDNTSTGSSIGASAPGSHNRSIPSLHLGNIHSQVEEQKEEVDFDGIEPLEIVAPVLPLPRRNSKGVQVCRRVDPAVPELTDSVATGDTHPLPPRRNVMRGEAQGITFAPHAPDASSISGPLFGWSPGVPGGN